MSGSVFSISFSRSWAVAVAVAAPFPFPFLGVGGTEIKHYLVDLLTFSCFNKLNQFQLHLIFLTWCIITNNIFQPCDLDLWLHNILGSSTFMRCGFGLWDHFSLWKHRLTYFPLCFTGRTSFWLIRSSCFLTEIINEIHVHLGHENRTEKGYISF